MAAAEAGARTCNKLQGRVEEALEQWDATLDDDVRWCHEKRLDRTRSATREFLIPQECYQRSQSRGNTRICRVHVCGRATANLINIRSSASDLRRLVPLGLLSSPAIVRERVLACAPRPRCSRSTALCALQSRRVIVVVTENIRVLSVEVDGGQVAFARVKAIASVILVLSTLVLRWHAWRWRVGVLSVPLCAVIRVPCSSTAGAGAVRAVEWRRLVVVVECRRVGVRGRRALRVAVAEGPDARGVAELLHECERKGQEEGADQEDDDQPGRGKRACEDGLMAWSAFSRRRR